MDSLTLHYAFMPQHVYEFMIPYFDILIPHGHITTANL